MAPWEIWASVKKPFWDYATFKEYEDNSAAIDAVYDEIFNQPIYRGDTNPSRGPGLANGNMNKIHFLDT